MPIMKQFSHLFSFMFWSAIAVIIINFIVLVCLGRAIEGQSYAESPGHMTPNEVQEMWLKNRK